MSEPEDDIERRLAAIEQRMAHLVRQLDSLADALAELRDGTADGDTPPQQKRPTKRDRDGFRWWRHRCHRRRFGR
nr:hypothetical protein [Saccharomonospora piscinae]